VPSALFAEQSGATLEEVAYKDAVPAIQDLIGGRIQVTFPDIVIGEDRHHAAAARLGHRQVRRVREARARAVDPLHQAREDRAPVIQDSENCPKSAARA